MVGHRTKPHLQNGTMRILRNPTQEAVSLTDRVYRQLRAAIITGKISGGTRLVESNLAADMQVSRTPVREALHKLALEGLLYSIPRAGYIVEEMSEYDIQDLFEVRIKIEQMAAGMAIEKITPAELAQLASNLEQTDAVLESGETHRMAALDTEFHGVIYRAARSRTLYRICQTISDHTLKYRMALIHLPEIACKTRDGHARIVEAILSKKPDLVAEAIQSHLQLAQADISDLLRRTREDAFLSQPPNLKPQKGG